LRHGLGSPALSAGLARRARLPLLPEEPNNPWKQAAQAAGRAPRHARQGVRCAPRSKLAGSHARASRRRGRRRRGRPCGWSISILQRKRLGIADFAAKAELAERLQAFIREWNEVAHPFAWSTKSVAKIMAKCEPPMAAAPAQPA